MDLKCLPCQCAPTPGDLLSAGLPLHAGPGEPGSEKSIVGKKRPFIDPNESSSTTDANFEAITAKK